VAADPADVDGELADRLAGIEQIQDAVPRGDPCPPPRPD
jgi:hypothetical protein